MSLREILKNQPWIGGAAGVILVVAAVSLAWNSVSDSSDKLELPSEIYFSDNDGDSFFKASSDQIPPFKHGDRDAVLAYVYQCGKGKPFVGYLLRYNEAGRAELAKLPPAERRGASPKVNDIRINSAEIKKPGQSAWVPSTRDSQVGEILSVRCPDGLSAEPVQP